ncbi:MAG TPA: phosphoribosylglycinamide formyltransferase [Bacillota bacterium]|nr:phosphoribosylglycinamide formyltransferase [Bacillota bacterium]HUM55962.1 phosphoribosylglycinamide formyltransferase [Bacillota bacterium]
MKKTKISVIVSGGGTNFQALAEAVKNGSIENAEIVRLISGSEKAFALQRAKTLGIPSKVIKDTKDPAEILKLLEEAETDLVVLAGYLKILDPEIISAYKRRIINIHPALLPKFGGHDMYGLNVHRAVIKAGEKESGATVHYVDEGVDTGEIILQRKVPVMPCDTPEELAARVLETEHEILPLAVKEVIAEWKEKR